MKRYSQQYICKFIDGKWRLYLYTFDNLRSYSNYLGKKWINNFYSYVNALAYLNNLCASLKFEFGKEDEIGLAKTAKTISVYHYYD